MSESEINIFACLDYLRDNARAYAKAKADEEQAAAEKAETKAAIADRLGLTADELALLLG